ncbi:hypothetical protein V5O48_019674 [Marasmius crinis-equi]|uniref:Uncharacterized protein n=1 Tax=Marasmius crinis-equi TaxID=585013 RepID=A0ABR3EHQ6_9AGAR
MVAIALSIVAASTHHHDLATATREASTIIYLVLTVLQTYQTLMLIRCELAEYIRVSALTTFAGRHGSFILALMSTLLLVRQAFATATMSNLSKEYDEKLWYPLIALPELLCVVLFSLPGLIPTTSKAELPEYSLSKTDSR